MYRILLLVFPFLVGCTVVEESYLVDGSDVPPPVVVIHRDRVTPPPVVVVKKRHHPRRPVVIINKRRRPLPKVKVRENRVHPKKRRKQKVIIKGDAHRIHGREHSASTPSSHVRIS